MEKIHLSVRNMVEFVLRQGSIDAGYASGIRAAQGRRLHQKLQRYRKKEALLQGYTYTSEFSLKHSFRYKELDFELEGRADGLIIKNDGQTCIEEIKSTTRPLAQIQPDPSHWHWAQNRCYGYIYCVLNQKDNIGLMLTYISEEENDWVSFQEDCTRDELEEFFYSVIEKYYAFAKMDLERISIRNETVGRLGFPYEDYRKKQRELAVSIYKTIYGSRKIFVQAPTGTGKTISALFPAVKSLAAGLTDKIFYLTAKTITRQAAEEALGRMEKLGTVMRSLTLTAKEKICLSPGCPCTPEGCPYANGHFDRVNEAILDIIPTETGIGRNTITAYAEKHKVCPHEFSLDVSMFCDCIICDYNYAYDPKAQLKRFFAGDCRERLVMLHDEAHNLTERSREMFSAIISRDDLYKGRRALKARKGKLYKALSKGLKYFEGLDEKLEANHKAITVKELPEELINILWEASAGCDEWLTLNTGHAGYEEVLSLYFLILDYLRTSEIYDERFITLIQGKGKDISLKLLCLDPSGLLAQTQEKARSSIFFSATLMPLDYFKESLGGGADDYALLLSSPYERSNLCLLVENSISTLYKSRAASYEPISDCVHAMASSKTGNYLVFFSSYEYMEGVWNIFVQKFPDITTKVQEKNMNEEEREKFLEQFQSGRQGTLLGFAVLGGLFSEGIDLVGDRLIGVAVVGVGLPLITTEREALAAYFQESQGLDTGYEADRRGFEYAYVYPGINKVLQAAGRVIRTENDRGVVLLIDSRYNSTRYKSLFPPEWEGYEPVRGSRMIEERLNKFWGK